MKKTVVLFMILIVFLTNAAFARNVPSKTIDDMTRFETEVENGPADPSFYIDILTEDEATEENEFKHLEIRDVEIKKLSESITRFGASGTGIIEYFDEVKDSEGNVVDLNEMLDFEALNIYEFHAVIAENYREEYGDVDVRMLFPTPYEKGEDVIVLIGIVTFEIVDEEVKQYVKWFAYDGIGIDSSKQVHHEQQGRICVVLDSEIILDIQHGTALLAIASK